MGCGASAARIEATNGSTTLQQGVHSTFGAAPTFGSQKGSQASSKSVQAIRNAGNWQSRNSFISEQAGLPQTGSYSRMSRPLNECGVSLSWLQRFCATVPPEFTTGQVVKEIVLPKSGKMRFVDACVEPASVGQPKHFVSHCWASPFHALVKALQVYLEAVQADDFVWLDIFAINQAPGLDQQDDLKNLTNVIAHCHQTLLVLDRSGVTLTRCWCLYEVWRTVSLKSAEHLLVLSNDMDSIQLTDVFNNLDVRKAQATVEKDRRKILDDIEASIGHDKMNQILKKGLVDSAIIEGRRAQDASGTPSGTSSTTDEAFKHQQLDRADTLNKCGEMLRMYGRPAEALPMYRLALELRTAHLGDEHRDAITGLANLAVCLDDVKQHAEAEALHRRALELRQRLFGASDAETATSTNSLAVCLTSQGRAAEAVPLFRAAIEARSALLGPEHPALVNSLNSLAGCLDEQHEPAEAEKLYLQVIALRKAQLGEAHPDTARSMNQLAVCLNDQERYKEAEALYRKVIDVRTKLLGPDHRDTLTSVGNLAICLHEQERLAEAEPLYRRVVEARTRALGPDHPDTLCAIEDLEACMNSG